VTCRANAGTWRGYGQSNDRERSRAAGFDAHLVKPVSIAKVTQTVDELLSP